MSPETSETDRAISVEQLGKRYRLGSRENRHETLLSALAASARAPLANFRRLRGLSQFGPSEESDVFWALRDVAFTVERGEVVGIIGRNGAGKSTLLKILSRITQPTHGRIVLNGRVSSLLEVGTGFHPELTGRENVYLNGTVLGMTKREIQRKFDEIVDFAGVEKFLDTPVKRYSSGMKVRLAFAVAAHLEPEILLIDEVLAVGDAAFQKKCLGKMDSVARAGRTVLFVSHDMGAIAQLTRRAIVLNGGRVSFIGPTEEAIEEYNAAVFGRTAVEHDVENAPRTYEGTGEAKILSLRVNRTPPQFAFDDDFSFSVRVRANEAVDALRVSMTIFSATGVPVGSCFSPSQGGLREGEIGDFALVLRTPRLAPGRYYCGVAIGAGDHRTGHRDYDVVLDTLPFEVSAGTGDAGTVAAWTRGWGPIVFPDLEWSEVAAVSYRPSPF